jgi:hypothetical protein
VYVRVSDVSMIAKEFGTERGHALGAKGPPDRSRRQPAARRTSKT